MYLTGFHLNDSCLNGHFRIINCQISFKSNENPQAIHTSVNCLRIEGIFFIIWVKLRIVICHEKLLRKLRY